MRVCFQGMFEKSSADEVIMSNQGEGGNNADFFRSKQIAWPTPDLLFASTKSIGKILKTQFNPLGGRALRAAAAQKIK